MDRVRVVANERLDLNDLLAMGALADEHDRRSNRALGQPNADPADGAYSIGCVLTPSSITFNTPAAGDITIGSALRVLIATTTSGLTPTLANDGAPNGDILHLSANAVVAAGTPTAMVPEKWLLARPTLLAGSDSDQRVFWQAAAPLEVTANTNTRLRRACDWLIVTSEALARAQIPNGYQTVCKMIWSGGAAVLDKWSTHFPEIANVADYPLGYLSSVKTALAALANEMKRIKGTAGAWDEATAGTSTLAWLAFLVNSATVGNAALGALVNSVAVGNTALGLLVNSAVVGNAALGALDNHAVIGNIALDSRIVKAHKVRCAISDLTFQAAAAPTWTMGYNVTSLTRTALGVFKINFTSPISVMNPTATFTQFFDAVTSTWTTQWRFVVDAWNANFVEFHTQYWNAGASTWDDADPSVGFVAHVNVFDSIP